MTRRCARLYVKCHCRQRLTVSFWGRAFVLFTRSAPVPLEDASAAGGEKYVPLLKRHTEKTYEERRADKERAGKVLSAPRPPGAGAGGAAAAGAAKPAGSDGEDEGGE